MKFVQIGDNHINPDHIVRVHRDEQGSVTIYLADGTWISAGRGTDVPGLLGRLAGLGAGPTP